jgi:para-aminobenzoate synthetase/4-amino-4-deoxychorismate lyase
VTHTQVGTAIFAGGAWLPRRPGDAGGPQPSLLLREPADVIVAHSIDEIPGLIESVEAAQRQGHYVAGYLAYEAGAAFGLATKATSTTPLGTRLTPDSLPLAWMGVYPPTAERESALPVPSEAGAADATPSSQSALSLNETPSEYCASIGKVRGLIAAGDTYQVNYTVRARFDLGLDPANYFLSRAAGHPVPYAAFLNLGPFQVISLSPELFLRRQGDRLESRPMKGTRPRGATRSEDVDLAYELVRSEKDRAENLMIVDMVRNDLGRVCRTGSVHVPALFALEPYGTVWQMASTVVGNIKPRASLLDIMRATFPGASVTGAPKHHTMEIIRDLESEPRGVYTGTVAIFLPGGDFTCNLAIRTIAHDSGRCLLGVGSGVVWDSDPQEEYDETLTKAAFVFRNDFSPDAGPLPAGATAGIFETMLLAAGDDAEHLERIGSSAAALGIPFSRQEAVERLAVLAATCDETTVVRLDLEASGELRLKTRPLTDLPAEPLRVLLSPFRTDPGDSLLRHKTADRPLYDREHARALELGCFDAVFLNVRDHVTEGAITNLFARFGEVWVTPPLTDGLLPGIWRARFMRETQAVERSLTLEELLAADEVVLGNSVRGKIHVSEIAEIPF